MKRLFCPKKLCIYHRVDLDGQCSAAIVRMRHPDVELLGWTYGDSIPSEQIADADRIILVDISFPPDVMLEIGTNRSIIWIDHHQTAIEDATNGRYDLVPGLRRSGTAACELCWEYFYPEEPLPRAVWLIGQWDVWNWPKLPEKDEIEAFQFGLRKEDTDPQNDRLWQELFSDREDDLYRCGGHRGLGRHITRDGEVIIKYKNKQKTRMASSTFETEIDGHRVLALNAGGGSAVFDSVWSKHPDCVAMLSFVWRGDKWTCSLYSDRGFDCSSVAKAHGGGGHAGAAGFESQKLPFAPFI